MKKRELLPSSIGGRVAEERLKTFLDWTFSGVLNRAWALRTAVVSFGIAVVLLPLPFTNISRGSAIGVFAIGLSVLAVWCVGELVWERRQRHTPYVPDPPAITVNSANRPTER
jgi:hypothetical protein